jgi:hypothetical protein
MPWVFLDCMLWMWAEPRDVPACVPYYTENFPGTHQKLAALRDRLPEATVVGPLVARPALNTANAGDTLPINLGGLCGALVDQPTLDVYAAEMARCALAALEGSAVVWQDL